MAAPTAPLTDLRSLLN